MRRIESFSTVSIIDQESEHIFIMQATKEQLLDRIKKFLELPGVCAETKRATILANCEKLSFEQLCEVTATLRIRVRKLASIVNSPEKVQEIQDAKDSLDKFFAKYGIRS